MKNPKYDQRWVLIANPVSGTGKHRQSVYQVAKELQKAGHTPEILWTTGHGHAEELATVAVRQGATHVVVCGGDGTIHEVVNGLVVSRPATDAVTLGIIPLGRANDLARTLNISRDLSSIIETLLSGSVRTIDLGKAAERYFITVATLGFDTAVAQYVAAGRAPGFFPITAAYLYGTLVNLLSYQPVWVQLKDEGNGFDGPVFLAAVGNTSSYGGGMKIAPTAVADDGRLDLCLVHQIPRLDVVKLLPSVFSGSHIKHPKVSIHSFQKIEITTKAPIAIWADGEPVAQTPVVFEVMPRALRVLAPEGN
jgi:diacylglycerol kinase (ATP)